MYIAVRKYDVEPDTIDEIIGKVEEGFVPIVKRASGFIAYYVLESEDGELVTVGLFEKKSGAQESVMMASNFVRDSLRQLLPNPPDVIVGDVSVCEARMPEYACR